ncbi:MAG: hypothetical protein ACFB8W_00590 [Elainellaceae cyanobacterium]
MKYTICVLTVAIAGLEMLWLGSTTSQQIAESVTQSVHASQMRFESTEQTLSSRKSVLVFQDKGGTR